VGRDNDCDSGGCRRMDKKIDCPHCKSKLEECLPGKTVSYICVNCNKEFYADENGILYTADDWVKKIGY